MKRKHEEQAGQEEEVEENPESKATRITWINPCRDPFNTHQQYLKHLEFLEKTTCLKPTSERFSLYPPNTWYATVIPDEEIREEELSLDKNDRFYELEKLFAECKDQCDAEVQNEIGLLYSTGENGFEKDHSKAMEWLLKSVDQNNNATALFNIGYMFEMGLGRNQDYSEALEWYLMAAEQDDAEAQYTVGLFYEEGRGVEMDKIQARFWFEKAADNGHIDAKRYLGLDIDESLFVPHFGHDHN